MQCTHLEKREFCATSGCERIFKEYVFDTTHWNSCEMLIVYRDNTFEVKASLELPRINRLSLTAGRNNSSLRALFSALHIKSPIFKWKKEIKMLLFL